MAALRDRWSIAMQEDAAGVSYVFCDTEGKPLRKSNFERRVWKVIRKAAKLPESVRFHDLRHTSDSLLLKAGVNVKVVAERLGHADIRVTLGTYAHVMPGMQDTAADAFDAMLVAPQGPVGYKLATDSPNQTPETLDAPTEVEAS